MIESIETAASILGNMIPIAHVTALLAFVGAVVGIAYRRRARFAIIGAAIGFFLVWWFTFDSTIASQGGIEKIVDRASKMMLIVFYTGFGALAGSLVGIVNDALKEKAIAGALGKKSNLAIIGGAIGCFGAWTGVVI